MLSFVLKFMLLLVVMLSSLSSVSALKILASDNEYFRPNHGTTLVNPLLITIEKDAEITKEGFSLVIPEDANFRFSASSLFFVQVYGSGAAKIAKGATLSPDLRKLSFQVHDELNVGDNFNVSNLEIVVYHKPNGYRGIGIDTNGDGRMEAQSSNGIRIDETYGLNDTLPPHEAFSVTGSYLAPELTLTATPPGDVDFSHYLVSFIDHSGALLSEKAEFSLSGTTLTVPDSSHGVRIKTRDIRENNSTGLFFPISFFSSSTGSSAPANTSTGASTSTWVMIPTTDDGSSIILPYVSKHKKTLNFSIALDAYIAKRVSAQAQVTEKRNAVVRLVEKFYTTRGVIPRREILTELKAAVLTLKAEWK